MKRKDFIKKTLAAGVGSLIMPHIIPASALGRNGFVPPSDRIVMAGIGLGAMGNGDMNQFLGKKEIQYIAVCDVDDNHNISAKKKIDTHYSTNDCTMYSNYKELLDKEKLDAVHIAIPDHWHAIVSIAAINKGLAVYGQKPLARSIKEGRAIVDAVKSKNTVWQTGSQQRSDERFRFCCELVRNGRIGKVKWVEVGLPNGVKPIGTPPVKPVPEGLNWGNWLGPAPWVPYRGICHWNWRWILAYSGGQLTDWAGHHIDIAHWGLGFERSAPVEIQGKGVYPLEGIYDVPVEYDITARYESGLTIRVANQSRLPHKRGISWYGEQGWIHVSRGGYFASDENILREQIRDDEIRLYKSNDHHQNFVDCIRTGKETVAPVEIAHRSVSVALLGEIAMQTEKKLLWDANNETFTNDEFANRLLRRPRRNGYEI